MRTTRWALAWLASSLALALGLGLSAWAQHGGHSTPAPSSAQAPGPKPIRITMEELHKAGGIPPGWKLSLPAGDAAKGRQVFVELECFSCHQVKGEAFPRGKPGDVGPDLTGMGGRHPTEYLFESIVNPNAVIVEGAGFTGHDGLSKMHDYRDSLTVAQLFDLVAYLQTLTGGGEHGTGAGHDRGGTPRSKGH